MKVSLSWLCDYVAVQASPAELAARLTMAGLEVERSQPIGDATGVVVAEVLAARKHPDGEKLTIVTVTDGSGPTEVVCGAPNVPAPGGKVAWARPGARLPGLGEVSARKIRGVLSPGMLCAEDELGLSDDHSGILLLPEDAPVGADALDGLRDVVFEINVTTNRPDCLGHLGIAREVAALYGLPLRRPPVAAREDAGPVSEEARVMVRDATGCPRYIARVIEGLRMGPSPAWVKRRLNAVGVRAISNVVDATNYVLYEFGQPLHAFDLDQLEGQVIVVRRAEPGERMQTLDGVSRELDPADLLIADGKRAVAVAGVMGGADAEVSERTRRVLLESAYFDPYSVRRTAKRLGLHTEASHRFERGVDPNDGVASASLRCAGLLCEWAGGRLRAGAIDAYPQRVPVRELTLGRAAVRRLLGVDLELSEMRRLLSGIGLDVSERESGLRARVPTFRPDLTREVDLIEEVARLHGYDRLPSTLPLTAQAPEPSGDPMAESARDALAACGLDEAICYGFTSLEKIAALGLAADDARARPVRIKNPLREETAALRTTLAPGLLSALKLNLDRGNANLGLFEIGCVFLAQRESPMPDERRTVGVVMAGSRATWLAPAEPLDLFDLKGVAELLLERLAVPTPAWTQSADLPFLHPGVAARIGSFGIAGEVHPHVRERFGIETRCFYLEIDLEALAPAGPAQFVPLPRFPQVTRDLSCFVDAALPAAAIASCVGELGEPLLFDLRLGEVYRDPARVPAGKKSMLWSMTYRAPDRTLTDEEATRVHERIVRHLVERLGIQPR